MCYALLKDKHVITLTSITLIFSLFSFFCISIVLGIAIVVSLVCGLIAPVIIFSDKKPVPNFLSIFTGVVPKSHPKKEMVRSCSVCGGEECNRQHTTNAFNISAHAHVYFTVPQSIDEALEEIFNLVLDHHIYYWYKEISVHDQLADEIRYIIRYAAASLGTRLTKVDLPSIILDQLIPCGLVHVDSYVEGSRKVRGNSSLESSVIQYLKSKKALHVALQSREDEANYLRAVVDSLIPYLIPKQYQESSLAKCFLQELLGRFLILQGMDLLADPDIVNFLFLLLFDDESLPIPPDTPEPKVLLLKSFSSVNTHPRNSSMRSNLSSVLKDQNLLYLFHSFLKAEEAINILSFCLAVEDFNRHILDPELTTEQLQYLHKEALELYHTYMVPTAIDKLDFLPEIVSQIKEIVHGDVKDIVKLRTTRPLFQAYEYAYNLLEREYLPLFMNSNAYFSHICGLKHQQTFQRTSNRDAETVQSTSTGRGSLGKGVAQRVGIGLASLSRQMVFKPSVINGDEDVMATVDEGSDVYTVFLAEDGCTARNALEGLSHAFRDLSAWRVSIPRVEERIDSSGKMEFVFIVDVTRIDVSGGTRDLLFKDNPEELHWEVERRYNEFYVLETKLTEFHGDFPDNNLPPRRSFFASKGTSFMHSRRQIFEGFLQKLLQNPSLRNSQLLFLFFKSKDEFTASYLPDVSLSRLLKEVPRKLIKERGQNLDAFISSFISSTSYNSLKNVAFDVDKALYNDESKLKFSLPCEDIKLTEGLYCDNVQSLRLSNVEDDASLTSSTTNVNGVVEIVLYIAIRLYGLSMTCLRVAMCFKILFGNTIDAGIAWFVRKKLNEAFRPPNLVKLIHLIRDALFFDPPSPRTKMDRLARESDIRDKVIHLLPKWMKKLFFVPELYIEGANTLVNSFQHPVLNKQLSYMLLDIILEELFPELRKREESDDTQYLSFLNRSSYVATS